MTRDGRRNMAASVRQRLLNKSREQHEDFNLILIRYALERWLYRLSQSPHHDRFLLKGATLFQIWSGQVHRPTRDLDLLGQGAPSPVEFEQLVREVCSVDVADDGLVFRADTVHAETMAEEEEYQGLRLSLTAYLASARIPVRIDIGFGDAVTPGPDEITYPTLLDSPAPRLKAYPRETVVAEKFQAMVMLGIANSRMKDFYDLWTLARQFEFSGPVLCAAIRATFARRQTALPARAPLGLTVEFTEDAQKSVQWRAFVLKSQLDVEEMALPEIAGRLRVFLMPPTEAVIREMPFDMNWTPNGPWSPTARIAPSTSDHR